MSSHDDPDGTCRQAPSGRASVGQLGDTYQTVNTAFEYVSTEEGWDLSIYNTQNQ